MYGATNYKAGELNKYRISKSNTVSNIKCEIDNRKFEENGVWVYRDGTKHAWVFEKYNCIADAVKRALRLKDAMVIINGTSIYYGKIDTDKAYYIDPRTNKVKVIISKNVKLKTKEYNGAYI